MERPDRRRGRLGWSAAQREVVAAHLESLLGAALVHTGSHRRAEALVEDALCAAAREVFDEDDPGAWLHAHLWARRRHRGDDARPDPAASAAGRPAARGNPRTLADAVAALPPEARAAVHLVDVEGLSYDQLARVLGTSTAAAAGVLHDARRRLVPVVAAAPAGRSAAGS